MQVESYSVFYQDKNDACRTGHTWITAPAPSCYLAVVCDIVSIIFVTLKHKSTGTKSRVARGWQETLATNGLWEQGGCSKVYTARTCS